MGLMQTNIVVHPHTLVLSYHVISRMYLVVLAVVLFSTGKCDLLFDHDYRASTKHNVTTQTTIYPSFWSVVNRKLPQNTQMITESTREFPTSSPSVYNEMKMLSSHSKSLKISPNTDSESQEHPTTKVNTNIDERTTASQPETTMSSVPETVANVCDTDQLEVTTNPEHINASTCTTYCSLIVNAPNSTAISVSVLDSDIDNAFTYFYTETLGSPILNSSKRINLISLHNTPCVTILQGNQFRFHFQNTRTKVRICKGEVKKMSACYETVHPLMEATQCRITLYESKIQTSQTRQEFVYSSSRHHISVNVTQFQARCTCDCPDTCMCTLGYRQWLSSCTITSQDKSTTTADLVVYTPTIRGLSFNNTGLHVIQHDAFLGLEGVVVLILSNNRLLMLQKTVCQNLPQLKVLILDHNKLVNLTSDSFTGPCVEQLLMLYLQSNELTYLPHDLFNLTSKLRYLNLKKNGLVQIPSDLFSSLEVLLELWLGDNAISTISVDVFDQPSGLVTTDPSSNTTSPLSVFASLGQMITLDLSGNAIFTLPMGVFTSLGNLQTLDLSDNNVTTLPMNVFAPLGSLLTLDLSDNSISTLPMNVFDSLGSLLVLDLSGNDISTFSVDVFVSLVLLHIFDLSGNSISTLPEGIFASVSRLQTLDLSGNIIFTLPVDVFISLDSLATLDLSSNAIFTLPVGVFTSLGNLATLDLSGNTISTLPVNVFSSLRSLRTLDLSGNALLTLPKGVFNSQRYLPTLVLSCNNISILPAGVFDSLHYLGSLDLSDNELLLLPHDVFRYIGKTLGLLRLNLRSNNISTLHAHVFDHLNKLLILDLSNNKLFSLPGELFLMLRSLKSLNICCNNLTIHTSQTFESLTQLKILDISKNSIGQFPPHLFESTGNLLSLEISENNLRTIPVTLFKNLSRLIYLNMSKNSLSRLPSFNAQRQLQVLDVSENQLTTLKQDTFENLKNLTFLSIAKNSVTALHSLVFFNLNNLEFINASYNAIHKIGSKVVSDETKLKTFDLRGNELYKVAHHSFTSFTNSTIIVDKYATCCFLNEEKCIPMKPRPEYLTCKRLLQDVVLRISVWVLGLSAFICNVIACCIRSRKQQAKIKVQTLFISNLALSDLLMGANMLILAIADVYYGQYFPSYVHTWRQSFACKLAGFLSIFSSEGSVFFITLISIDRMLRIKYPFGGHRLEIKSAHIVVTLAWLMALLISVIPISLTSDNENFYSISEVCIGIPIVRRHLTTFMNKLTEIKATTISSSFDFETVYLLDEHYTYVINVSVTHLASAQNITYTIAENAGSHVGSIYSIMVFIAVNCFCFVIVACCYVYIFIKTCRTTKRVSGSKNHRDELRMAKKMFAIVFTNFCCWVPLSFVCILTQSRVIEVSPDMYAWTVGFILPINSSINPFLYVLYETISDYLMKKQEERKDTEEIEMKVRCRETTEVIWTAI